MADLVTVNLGDLIPWVAIAISILSLIVSMYRIYRDRSMLVTYSEIVHDDTRDPFDPPPFLRILAVNRGNRPITLTDFGISVSRKETTWTPLKPEPVQLNEYGFLEGVSRKLGAQYRY